MLAAVTRERGTRRRERVVTWLAWLLVSTAAMEVDGAAAQDAGAPPIAVDPEAPGSTDEPAPATAPDAAPEEGAPQARAFEEPEVAPRQPLVPPGGVPPIPGPQPVATPPEPERQPDEVEEPEPIPPPRYDVALHLRVGLPPGSGFDEALAAHRYDASPVIPSVYVGAAGAVLEWLWVGGRLGTRGRTFGHVDRDEATLYAADLLVTAQVRLALGSVVEVGALVAGGASYIAVRVNGVLTDQVTARFGAEATVAFRIGRNFALGPRVGWDYFQWENMNAYGDGVDLGGVWFGIALEGRE